MTHADKVEWYTSVFLISTGFYLGSLGMTAIGMLLNGFSIGGLLHSPSIDKINAGKHSGGVE